MPSTKCIRSPNLCEPIPDGSLGRTRRLALAWFLAGCSGLTREAYALDLRQVAA